MDHYDPSMPPGGVAQKVQAVLGAIDAGHREIDAIAHATSLPPTTVIRVAARLRELGRIRLAHRGQVEFLPAVER